MHYITSGATRNEQFGLMPYIAICTDQRNIRERNHQVHQMGKIYSNARMVLIWLGTGLESSSAAPALTLISQRSYWLQAFATQDPKDEESLSISQYVADFLESVILEKALDCSKGCPSAETKNLLRQNLH